MKDEYYYKGYVKAMEDYNNRGYKATFNIYEVYMNTGFYTEEETKEAWGYCDAVVYIIENLEGGYENMEPWDKFAEGFIKGIEMFESDKELMEDDESF